jgi:hypothetical protein
MYEAIVLPHGETVRFRSVDALARRLGGNGWVLEHDSAFTPSRRTIMVLRNDRHGQHVVCRIRVDANVLQEGA